MEQPLGARAGDPSTGRLHPKRVIPALAAVAVYALTFALLEPLQGPAASALSMMPVAVAAWRLGMYAGLLVGLSMLPLNMLLWALTGNLDITALLRAGGFLGGINSVMVGLVVGLLSDLRSRLAAEHTDLSAEVEHGRAMEAELSESRQQSLDIIESMRDAIVISVGTEHVFVNSAYLELLGLDDMAQAMGLPVDHFVLPQDQEPVKQRLLARQRGEPVSEEHRYIRLRRSDGAVRTVQTSSVAIAYRGQPASMAVLRDVTDQADAQEQLRESEERYRALVELCPETVAVVSDGKYVYVSNAGQELFGADSVDLLVGRGVLEFVHPDHREQVAAQLRSTAGEGAKPEPLETKHLRLDGRVIDVEQVVAPILYGGAPATQMLLRDITQRKRADEELRIRARELEALSNISAILVGCGPLQERLDRAIQELAHAVEADRVSLRQVDGSQEQLRLVAVGGPLESRPPSHIPRQISRLVFERGEPVAINDYPSHPHASAPLIELGVRSMATLPFRVRGEIKGTINAVSLQTGHFTPERVHLLSHIADEIGALLENSRLYQEIGSELEQGRRRLAAFQTAASRLSLGARPENGLRQLVDVARELIEADSGALVVWDDDGRITTGLASGQPGTQRGTVRGWDLGQGLLGLIRDGGRSIRISDLSTHPRAAGFQPGHPPMARFLGAPININGGYRGALYLTRREARPEFTPDDDRLLCLFAVLVGIHLENAGLYEQVTRERSTLAAVQASMTEGLVVIDHQGRIVYFNQAAEKLLGLDPQSAQGRPVHEALGVISPDFETKETLDSLLEMLRTGVDGPIIVELALLRPERCQLSLAVFPIPGGSADCMTGMVVRDVTQERTLERRRDAFVSIASHELRTPMTGIMGFAELLLNRDPPDEVRREWLGRIHRDSRRLAAIVDDLLDVSRIQSGRLVLKRGNVALRPLIEEEVARVRATTGIHEFRVEVPPDLPGVSADEHKLAQVLANLLDNAVKYSPQGGLITVSARHDQVEQRVVTSIADQGIGIDPADQEELFASFRRISQPETEAVGGTGLGLYIVKGLVELMQGEVWVESDVGKGSTFRFSIPLLPQDEPAAPALLGASHPDPTPEV